MSESVQGNVKTVMQETRLFPPSSEFASKAQIGSFQPTNRCTENRSRTTNHFGTRRPKSICIGSNPITRFWNGTNLLQSGLLVARPMLRITASIDISIEETGQDCHSLGG